MSSETPPGPPEDRPTEPFARGRIQWSRPPEQVFRVGPLPKSETVAPQRPVRGSGMDFLTGSMIPRARPPAEPEVQPEPAAPVEAVAPEAVAPPPPEPEPVVAQPEPEPEPVVAAAEIVIEPETPEPAVTVPPPLSSDPKPTAKPRSLPSVVVTPAIYASVGAAMQKVAKNDRWLVVAGIAAVVVIGGFVWLATLPGPQPVAPAPTPLAADAPVVEDVPLVAEATLAGDQARPVERAAPAPRTVTPPTPQPRASTPARSAPVFVAPVPVETTPRPYIETTPLVVEPPTPAAPPPVDPSAPIATRPQPLD